jgi:hypothetical protein
MGLSTALPLNRYPSTTVSQSPALSAGLKSLRRDENEPARIVDWAFRGLLNLPVNWNA